MKSVCILGSTGSIGKQALQVVADNPDLRVVGLSCGSQVEVLEEQAEAFGVVDVGVAHVHHTEGLRLFFQDFYLRATGQPYDPQVRIVGHHLQCLFTNRPSGSEYANTLHPDTTPRASPNNQK